MGYYPEAQVYIGLIIQLFHWDRTPVSLPRRVSLFAGKRRVPFAFVCLWCLACASVAMEECVFGAGVFPSGLDTPARH